MMTGPLFEIDTKETCLLCFSPNCRPMVEGRREEGDEPNFDKLNTTKHGFRVLLRYLKVDFTKLSHFSTASAFHRLFIKSYKVNLSVSLCNECSSVTNDFFELFQVFENIRIQLDLCVTQLHQFIETGRKDAERCQKYRERMNAGNNGDLGLVQSSIAEELRSEVQKKCSLKLERSLPRIMVTKCHNSGDIRPTEGSGFQRGSLISRLKSKEPAEEKGSIPTLTTTPLPVANNKRGVKRNEFLGSIAKIRVKNKEKNLVDFQKRMQLHSSQSQSVQRVHSAKPKKDSSKQQSISRPLQRVLADGIPTDAEPCSKTKLQLVSEIKRKRRLKTSNSFRAPKSRFVGKAEKTGGKWKCLECGKQLTTYDSFYTHYRRFHLHSEINGQHQPRKCFKCDKIFKHRGLLERHRMIKHTMSYFRGQIPSSISESRLESTLAHFVKKVQCAEWMSLQSGGMAEKCPCPFCKKAMHCTERAALRYHFLRSHFSDVIEHGGKQIETTSGDNERSVEETTPIAGYYHRRPLYRSGTTLTNCKHCGRTFNSNFHLRRHIISDHSYNFFKHRLPEEVSKEGFEKGLASMMKKLELTHRLGFSFECSVCGKGCRNRWTTRMHLLLAHFKQVVGNSVTITSPSAPITKSIESEPIVAFEVVDRLKTEHHQNELLKVENMDEEMTMTEPFVVKVEPDRVEDDIEMETEAQTQSKKRRNLKKNVCTICGKVLANPEMRRRHYRRVHLRITGNWKTESPGKCELCGKIYSQAQYLFRHKLQVHPIELLKDNLPAEVTKQQLNEAIDCILEDMTPLSIENKGGNKSNFVCHFCNTKRTDKVNWKIHLLQSHLEKVVHKIGEPRSRPKKHTKPRSSSLSQTPAPGTQKCEHCAKYLVLQGGNLRKHLMLEHPLIFYKDRLPQGISETDFEQAFGRVQAAMKVLQKNRNDPRHFMECTLCSRKIRKHHRDLRLHVLRCHLDKVLKEAELIHGGNPSSPEHILPDLRW